MLITGLGTAIPTGTVSQDLAYQAMQQLWHWQATFGGWA
jgi:hypothetical protein